MTSGAGSTWLPSARVHAWDDGGTKGKKLEEKQGGMNDGSRYSVTASRCCLFQQPGKDWIAGGGEGEKAKP